MKITDSFIVLINRHLQKYPPAILVLIYLEKYTNKQPLQTIREQYPNLTELDILVICLIGIGMDNDEICTILRMEKRTLYRRRQLIAQRVGMSSTQLELFATTLITDFEE